MIAHPRLLVHGGAVALGLLTACSSGPEQGPVGSNATMPQSADFIADVEEPDGSTMTVAIAVQGKDVMGYATNGVDDQSYFFGTQDGGQMTLQSEDGDTLTGSFDGNALSGELKLSEPNASPVSFEAPQVQAPAGMYTAIVEPNRATWVLRPNGSTVGMTDMKCVGHERPRTGDGECRERDTASDRRASRPMRAPEMSGSTMTANMGGAEMKPTKVTGGGA